MNLLRIINHDKFYPIPTLREEAREKLMKLFRENGKRSLFCKILGIYPDIIYTKEQIIQEVMSVGLYDSKQEAENDFEAIIKENYPDHYFTELTNRQGEKKYLFQESVYLV